MSVARETGRNYMAFFYLALEITKYHFYCLLRVMSDALSPTQIKVEET